MEQLFRQFANHVAMGAEFACVLCITYGVVEAVLRTIGAVATGAATVMHARREVYARFAAWIILALEFALAADIVRTAIAPSWNDIGMLAAIATIRTGLNYFLERDLERFSPDAPPDSAKPL